MFVFLTDWDLTPKEIFIILIGHTRQNTVYQYLVVFLIFVELITNRKKPNNQEMSIKKKKTLSNVSQLQLVFFLFISLKKKLLFQKYL